MRKLLALLFAFFSLSVFADQPVQVFTPICNDNMCSIYLYAPAGGVINLSNVGNNNYSAPYAALVPAGTTATLYIMHASIHYEGAQIQNMGGVYLKVESPAGSGNWKVLATIRDGYPPADVAFNPGVAMTPSDEICFTEVHGAYWATPSEYGTSPVRKIGVWLHYRVGP